MKDATKELILECVNQIQSGMRQVEDAIERLEDATPVRICDPFYSTDRYNSTHGTEFTVHVYKGIKLLAKCLEKEPKHPTLNSGWAVEEENDRIAFENGDFLWFQIGTKTGYKFE